MVTNLVEVKNYDGQGYQSLVHFGSWRVAVLRFLDELNPDNIRTMERHTATDEVFVLTKGKAMLITGGNKTDITDIQATEMAIGEVCNIKKNAWHTITLSQDAHLIIIENDDTTRENTEYILLPTHIQTEIRQFSRVYIHDQ